MIECHSLSTGTSGRRPVACWPARPKALTRVRIVLSDVYDPNNPPNALESIFTRAGVPSSLQRDLAAPSANESIPQTRISRELTDSARLWYLWYDNEGYKLFRSSNNVDTPAPEFDDATGIPSSPTDVPSARDTAVLSTDGSFVCSLCGEEFQRRQRLETHVNMHRNEKPYVCDGSCGDMNWYLIHLPVISSLLANLQLAKMPILLRPILRGTAVLLRIATSHARFGECSRPYFEAR